MEEKELEPTFEKMVARKEPKVSFYVEREEEKQEEMEDSIKEEKDASPEESKKSFNSSTTSELAKSIIRSTTSTIAEGVNAIIRPKSKSYIWHRTQGTSRPYPLQASTKRKRHNHRHHHDSMNNNGDDLIEVCECHDRDCDICRDLYRKPPCFLCYAPMPVYYFANTLEQNWFCDTFGKVGCFGKDNFFVRRRILMFGLVANCLSLLLSIIACLSISLDYDLLKLSSFTEGLAYLPIIDLPLSHTWIGLRGVAIIHFKGRQVWRALGNYTDDADLAASQENLSASERELHVYRFDELCHSIHDNIEERVGTASYVGSNCESCALASSALVSTVILSTIFILPNITTDVLRMYPNYDMNCQKFFGSIVSLLSTIFSLIGWRAYGSICFKSFARNTGKMVIPFFPNGTIAVTDELLAINIHNGAVDDGTGKGGFPQTSDEIINVAIEWKAGLGLICIVTATFLKIIDVIAIGLIPTPSISHTRKLQDEYEKLYGDTNSTHNKNTVNNEDDDAHNKSKIHVLDDDDVEYECNDVNKGKTHDLLYRFEIKTEVET